MKEAVTIRDFAEPDAPQLIDLMRRLARFEGYIDDFSVTEPDLLRHGLGPNALFHVHVAERGGCLVGMAVTYIVPWTFTLRPRLVLKELFVSEAARRTGEGRALMRAVVERGGEVGADHVAWTVMTGNEPAERFYRALGGRADAKWSNWRLDMG